MKILLLGAAGQVGFELHRSLNVCGNVVVTVRQETLSTRVSDFQVDFLYPQTLYELIIQQQPDVIVNAVAYTAVDRAEDEIEIANIINGEALSWIGDAAKKINAYVVHFSTDYVFAGDRDRPYLPTDEVAPCNAYGVSKRQGEVHLMQSGCQYTILRTAWVYAARSQNFLQTMLRLAKAQDMIRVVNDQYGAPTSARVIAEVTAHLIQQQRHNNSQVYGLHHLTCTGQASWYDFAQTIFTKGFQLGLLQSMPTLQAITTAEFITKAKRPQYSVLDTTSLQHALKLHFPHWQEALLCVMEEMASQ